MGYSLKDALNSASKASMIEEQTEHLEQLLLRLTSENVPPEMRVNLLTLIFSAIELADIGSSTSYPAEAALFHTRKLMNSSQFVLQQVENNRQAVYGYSLQHSKTGKLLPKIYATQGDAKADIDNYSYLGADPSALLIVPVKVTSQVAVQPQPPRLPPPVPAAPIPPVSPAAAPAAQPAKDQANVNTSATTQPIGQAPVQAPVSTGPANPNPTPNSPDSQGSAS
jgi:hypothetical protein